MKTESSKAGLSAGVKTGIHFIIMLTLYVFVSTAEPLAPITPAGMQMLAVFLFVLWGWMTIGFVFPSLVGIWLLGFNEIIGHNGAFAGSFGNPVVAQMLFIFFLIKLLEINRVPEVIATWSMSRKIVQGRPVIYSLVVLLITCLMGMVNMFLSILVMWAIMYGVFEKVGYKKHDTYVNVMLIGIVMFSMMGLIIFPFVDNGLIIMSAYANITGSPIPYGSYLMTMIPVTIVLAVVWLLVGKYILRMDMSKIKDVDNSVLDMSLLNVTKQQVASMVIIVVFILSLLCQNFIPEDIPVLGMIAQSNVFVSIVICFAIGALWHIDGKPVMEFNKLAGGIVWDSWCLTAFVLLLTAQLTGPDTGITAFCVKVLQPMLGGLGVYALVVVVMIFAFIVTNVCNNIVVTLCIIPIMFALSQTMGFNIQPVAMVIMMASHFALLTPAASGPAALMFGNTGWLSKGDIYKVVPLQLISALLVVLTIGYAWANMVF